MHIRLSTKRAARIREGLCVYIMIHRGKFAEGLLYNTVSLKPLQIKLVTQQVDYVYQTIQSVQSVPTNARSPASLQEPVCTEHCLSKSAAQSHQRCDYQWSPPWPYLLTSTGLLVL